MANHLKENLSVLVCVVRVPSLPALPPTLHFPHASLREGGTIVSQTNGLSTKGQY